VRQSVPQNGGIRFVLLSYMRRGKRTGRLLANSLHCRSGRAAERLWFGRGNRHVNFPERGRHRWRNGDGMQSAANCSLYQFPL